MATISGVTRPAYVYDQANNQWVPIGVGPHTHSLADLPSVVSSVGGSVIDNQDANQRPLTIRGAVSQLTSILDVQNSNLSSLLTVSQNGNVGVGTSSPFATFHVNGSMIASSLRTNANNDSLELFTGSGFSTEGNAAISIRPSASGYNDGGMEFYAGGAERARITSAGRVGIGTSIPYLPLHIAGVGYPTVVSSLGTATGSAFISNQDPYYGLIIGSLSNGSTWMQNQRVDGNPVAYNIIMQPSGGNVAIGGTAASTKLEVTGEITASGGYYGPLLSGVSMTSIVANNTVFAANTNTIIGKISYGTASGVYALRVAWGYGDNNAGSQLYWETNFGGIFGVASAGGYFNGSPSQEVVMYGTHHHANLASTSNPRFFLYSDSSNNPAASYGALTLYIRFPQITKIDGFTIQIKRLI
jgi:hypothetical protein